MEDDIAFWKICNHINRIAHCKRLQLINENEKRNMWKYNHISSKTVSFTFFSPSFLSTIKRNILHTCWNRGRTKENKKKGMCNYRWVASYTSDTTCNQWKEIGNRPAEVIIPWALPSLLIEIMKSCSLYLASISLKLGTSDTVINNIRNENFSNFTIRESL